MIEPGIRVLKSVMVNRKMNLLQKLILCRILQMSTLGRCIYTNSRFAEEFDCTERNVRNVLRKLEDMKHIRMEFSNGNTVREIIPTVFFAFNENDPTDYVFNIPFKVFKNRTYTEVLIAATVKQLQKKDRGCCISDQGLAKALSIDVTRVRKIRRSLSIAGVLEKTGFGVTRKLTFKSFKGYKETKNEGFEGGKNNSFREEKKMQEGRKKRCTDTGILYGKKDTLFEDKSSKAFLTKRTDKKSLKTSAKKLILKSSVKKNNTAPAKEIKFAKRLETKPYQRSLLPEAQVNPGVPTKLKKFNRDVFDAAQLYKRLVEIGCLQHKMDSKAYAYSIRMLSELISVRESNPYSNIHGQKRYADLLNKKFTVNEIFDIFAHAFCDPKNPNKIKSAGTFIMCHPKGAPAFSPFFSEYTSIVESEKRSVELTKEAESLKRAFDRMFIKNIDNRGFNRLSTMVLKTTEGFIVAPALRHIHYDDKVSVFCTYVSEKIQRINFKVGYLFGETFMNQFVEDMRKNGVLIRGTAQSVHNQMYGGI